MSYAAPLGALSACRRVHGVGGHGSGRRLWRPCGQSHENRSRRTRAGLLPTNAPEDLIEGNAQAATIGWRIAVTGLVNNPNLVIWATREPVDRILMGEIVAVGVA